MAEKAKRGIFPFIVVAILAVAVFFGVRHFLGDSGPTEEEIELATQSAVSSAEKESEKIAESVASAATFDELYKAGFVADSKVERDELGKGQSSTKSQGRNALTEDEARQIGREEARAVAANIAEREARKISETQLAQVLSSSNVASAGSTDDFGGNDDFSGDSLYSSGDSFDDDSFDSSSSGDFDSGSSFDDSDYSSSTFSDDSYGDTSFDDDSSYSDSSFSDDNFSGSNTTAASASPQRAPVSDGPSAPLRAGPTPPPALVIKPWWPPRADQSSSALQLLYVGQIKNTPEIAVLFSESVDENQSIGDFIKVTDDNGAVVSTSWSTAANPALIRSGNLPSGRYLVALKPGLKSSEAGKTQILNTQGAVYIK